MTFSVSPPSTTSPSSAILLTADDACRLALRAQRLATASDRRGGVAALVRALGAIQLDTISVLARSHELVAYARLGAVPRARIEAAYSGSGATFEYWAHAASILPIEHWPLFAFRRRFYRQRQRVWAPHDEPVAKTVLARLRDEGPLTATELGGARKATGWWGWSEVKRAAENLLAAGELICVRRVGWRRVYDLPERVVPPSLLHDDLDDAACHAELIRQAGQLLGVGTAADLADYYRLKIADVVALAPRIGLTPVRVEGWTSPAWADPEALASMAARGRRKATLVSPFDSLVWDRKRTARLFGLDHRLEAYVPKAERKHGYFAMPVLAGGRLVARVDPARANGTLIARHVIVEPAHARPARLAATSSAIGEALREAASWVGASAVTVERVSPASAASAISAGVK